MLPHLPDSYALAIWLLRDPHDAEDVVQEAYLKAFRAFCRYEDVNSIAWILKIVRTSCIDLLASKQRSNVIPLDGLSEGERSALFEQYMSTHDQQPEDAANTLSEIKVLRGAIYRLPDDYREIIVLREFQDRSYREISFILNMPIGTVMSRLSRARKQLNKHLLAISSEGRENELP